jgi:hypothetical protein
MDEIDFDHRYWVEEIVNSPEFAEYEKRAKDNVREHEVESGFCVQYFKDGRINFYDFDIGDNGSVTMSVPHGSDRLIHVHYHPGNYVSPSTADIHEADKDAAILGKELEVPPVHMIGSVAGDDTFYLVKQRKKNPGYIEKFLLSHSKPNKWRRWKRKKYEYESNKMLFEEITKRLGEEKEIEMRKRPIEEVLDASEMNYRDIAVINARALEKSYGYKTGIIGSYTNSDDDSIDPKRPWKYGNAELFE